MTHLHLLPLEERRKQDGRWQEHWYRHVAGFCRGRSVLDVGAGSGYGCDILREGGATAEGCDPLPLRNDIVWKCGQGGWEDRSYDYALAVDVIEHVEDDRGFLAALERIARFGVFLSTPNWNVTRCANPHHVREYTPDELKTLLGQRDCLFWTSDAHCKVSSGFDATAPNFGVLIRL